jgi:hypothetical protein
MNMTTATDSLKEYMKHRFLNDCRKLKLHKPNSVIQAHASDFRVDADTQYFGGSNWADFDRNMSPVLEADRPYFCLGLFCHCILDMTIFSYFKEYYAAFRSRTIIPKFGWSGFGVHYNNPALLINLPEQKGILNATNVSIAPQVYGDYWETCIQELIAQYQLSLTVPLVLKAVLSDDEMNPPNLSDYPCLSLIREELQKRI